ncbi:hypothetical protein CR513_54968, partial [Mucuna pruriens]
MFDPLWKGRVPNISYFHPFGYECFILNTKENLGKTFKVKESIHVEFNDYKPNKEYQKDLQISSKEPNMDDEPKEDKILGNVQDIVRTRFKDQAQVALLSKVKPKNVEDSLMGKGWINMVRSHTHVAILCSSL